MKEVSSGASSAELPVGGVDQPWSHEELVREHIGWMLSLAKSTLDVHQNTDEDIVGPVIGTRGSPWVVNKNDLACEQAANVFTPGSIHGSLT